MRDKAVRVRRESQSLQPDFERKLIRVRSVAGQTESRSSRPGLWRVPEGHFHFGVGKPARCTPGRGDREPGSDRRIRLLEETLAGPDRRYRTLTLFARLAGTCVVAEGFSCGGT